MTMTLAMIPIQCFNASTKSLGPWPSEQISRNCVQYCDLKRFMPCCRPTVFLSVFDASVASSALDRKRTLDDLQSPAHMWWRHQRKSGGESETLIQCCKLQTAKCEHKTKTVFILLSWSLKTPFDSKTWFIAHNSYDSYLITHNSKHHLCLDSALWLMTILMTITCRFVRTIFFCLFKPFHQSQQRCALTPAMQQVTVGEGVRPTGTVAP